MNNAVLTKEESKSVGYNSFYCNSCKGYVLVKGSFGKRFCKNCNEVIE